MEYVQLGSVDNVILKVLDPVFVGYTALHNYAATMKSCIKANAQEAVGVIAKKNNKYEIVEYTEIGDRANEIDNNG